MDSDEEQDQRKGFAQHGGEPLDLGADFNSDEDVEDEDEDEEEGDEQPPAPNQHQQQQQTQQRTGPHGGSSHGGSPGKDVKGEQVKDQPYDLAVDVNDSEEIESDEDDDEDKVNVGGANQLQQQQQQTKPGAGVQLQPTQKAAKKDDDDEDDDEDKEVPGAYNPAEFSGLQVSSEVRDLFEYIQRYKPQKIDLETKLKPFIPEYIPAVGEVDSFLKMPKPDGTKEDLGITVLDEPSLNHEDAKILEYKYIESKKISGIKSNIMSVDVIENADKKPKEISRWINSVQDLHKTRPPPTVNYTKQMPDFDLMMQEWSPEMEQALREIPFPGPEIDMHSADYARLVCSMVDIPSHKLANNKSVIESLHVLFTLFSEFKQNIYLNQQNQEPGYGGADIAQF